MTVARRVPVAGRRAATGCGRAAAAGWRAAAAAADRIWYGRPGVLMTAYVGLIAASREAAHSAGRSSRQAGLEVAVLVLLIWCWRVTRGGGLSRILLLLTTWWAIGFSVAHLAVRWDIQDAVVLAISAAQLALLLSPAVYLAAREDMAVQFRATGRWLVPVAGGGRTDPQAEPARSALTLRLRPRWWLLLAALGSGLVITLTCLITVHYAVLPHCLPPSHPSSGGPAASCAGFGRGYPLPVWSTITGPHPAFWPALARDGIQWVAVSLAALQAIWLWWNARPTYLPARRAAPSARPAA